MKTFILFFGIFHLQPLFAQDTSVGSDHVRIACQQHSGQGSVNKVVVAEQLDADVVSAEEILDIDTGFKSQKAPFRVSIYDKPFTNIEELSKENLDQILQKEPTQLYEGAADRLFQGFSFKYNGTEDVRFLVDFRQMQFGELSIDGMPYALHCLDPILFQKETVDESMFIDENEETQTASQ